MISGPTAAAERTYRCPPPTLETLLRRDRVIVAVGLVLLVAIAWGYTVWMSFVMGPGAMGSGNMGEMAAMPYRAPWSVADAMVAFVMWTVMMVAMMIPTAAPMTLMFAAIERRRKPDSAAALRTVLFIGGQIAVWSGVRGNRRHGAIHPGEARLPYLLPLTD
jgi:predicted metal-binding membrane protein